MNEEQVLDYIKKERALYTDDYLRLDKIIEPLINYFNEMKLFTLASCGSHVDSDSDNDKSRTSRAYISFSIPIEQYDNYVLLKNKFNEFVNYYQNTYCKSLLPWCIPSMICDVYFDCDNKFNSMKDFINISKPNNFIYKKWNYEKNEDNIIKLYWEKEWIENSIWKIVKKEEMSNDVILKDCLNICFGLDEPYERRYHFFKELYKFLKIEYNPDVIILEEERLLFKNGIAIRK